MTARSHRAAHRLLAAVIRGRRGRGGEWGEALLAEFDEVSGTGEVLRWTFGGLRVAWRERRARLAAAPRAARLARRAVLAAILVLLAALPAQAFVATVVDVPSASMRPSVHVGDRLLVDRVSYRLTGLRHGDLVVARMPVDHGTQTTLRRVLGLPGDRIACRDGALLRNGTRVPEPYLAPGTTTTCAPTTVGPGRVYLLGDDRAVSLDSRQTGAVAISAVVGRVLTRVWRT